MRGDGDGDRKGGLHTRDQTLGASELSRSLDVRLATTGTLMGVRKLSSRAMGTSRTAKQPGGHAAGTAAKGAQARGAKTEEVGEGRRRDQLRARAGEKKRGGKRHLLGHPSGTACTQQCTALPKASGGPSQTHTSRHSRGGGRGLVRR
jgi:hypothetical protein